MLAYPSMLIPAAEKAGIKVPPDANNYDPNEFPHFDVFCGVQLCRPMRPGEHWENAHIVAALPEDEIRKVTIPDLIARGLSWQS